MLELSGIELLGGSKYSRLVVAVVIGLFDGSALMLCLNSTKHAIEYRSRPLRDKELAATSAQCPAKVCIRFNIERGEGNCGR